MGLSNLHVLLGRKLAKELHIQSGLFAYKEQIVKVFGIVLKLHDGLNIVVSSVKNTGHQFGYFTCSYKSKQNHLHRTPGARPTLTSRVSFENLCKAQLYNASNHIS